MNIRHGDVAVLWADELPAGATRVGGPIVLAYGEATGHAHRVTGGNVSLWDVGTQRYMMVEGGLATLDHEEHGPVTIQPGTYRVVIQQAWDPFTEQGRRVAD
jgi:archaeosine-15-forming tRNA-guanine transglycosylase